MTMAERIRYWREQRVLGQGELAERAGLNKVALWRIEMGQRQPRPATIRKLADALGIEPAILAGSKN